MNSLRRLTASAVVLSTLFSTPCCAQYPDMVLGSYLDPATGANFTTWTAKPDSSGSGGVTFGVVLPADAAETDATEYIGYLSCASTSADRTGWCGIAHGGHMIQGLLLVAWPHKGQVLTSFRWATDYFMPGVYQGNSTITQISSSVNDTGYELIYRCENCFAWEDGEGYLGSMKSSSGELGFGYAQAADGPEDAGCPAGITLQYHTQGYSTWVGAVDGLTAPDYSALADGYRRSLCRVRGVKPQV
ncbi:uncharacterized protein DNG_08955 [Cephalotrichum gorgonifer]|uniref:Cellobiose dehydrogenase-like cytochrome domain-containing protein n=1 Tax=Cephalotrichum gorgonifer TaxID=2041049 RepID=A0AAE8N4K2_9PEZI|nr:uncharacterized protein DNG_08955 [Cephalotrichum gorgonifer]